MNRKENILELKGDEICVLAIVLKELTAACLREIKQRS